MKKCEKCDDYHKSGHPHFGVVKKLSEKGFPVHEKKYATAHAKANAAEKKKFGKKAFKELAKLDEKAGHKHKLIGKNLKSGKLEVSKSVPKRFRDEVAYHEKVENDILTAKKKRR